MMSPDPPKEECPIDPAGEWEEEVLSGPHELDTGGEESEYSESEEENPPGGEGRGYYQLLIPFPTEPEAPENEESPPPPESAENEEDGGGQIPVKREIELTEEKVEAIMSAMKGFVLPPSAIPPWANQIQDHLWKQPLNKTKEEEPQPQNPPA